MQKVFHDADYDLRLLRQDYGWQVANLFDTRIAAQLLGERAFGLAALLEQEFGVRLDKKHQRADWSMRPLTPDMLDYAAQDTYWLLGLRDRLRAAGFTAFTETVASDKGSLTRVRVGPVLTRADADRLRGQVSAKAGVSGMVRPHP